MRAFAKWVKCLANSLGGMLLWAKGKYRPVATTANYWPSAPAIRLDCYSN